MAADVEVIALVFGVRAMPPTYSGSASRMDTGTRSLLRRYPAVNPAGPAPMIATFVLAFIISPLGMDASPFTPGKSNASP